MEKDDAAKRSSHIKFWPADERPREILLEKGPASLSDAALLAILLRSGCKGKDAVALAREMLTRFGGISGLMSAGYDELIQIKGIGMAKTAQLLAAMEIIKRQLREKIIETNLIRNPSDLFEYLKSSMGHLTREEFRILHLNRSHRLISEDILFHGTVDESVVYAREVIETALRRKASAVILAHNHPTGPDEASPEDVHLTQALVAACHAVQIPVLDHCIVARNRCLSMKQFYPDLFEVEDDIA